MLPRALSRCFLKQVVAKSRCCCNYLRFVQTLSRSGSFCRNNQKARSHGRGLLFAFGKERGYCIALMAFDKRLF